MRRIAYMVIPDFQVMVFAGTTVFELANLAAGVPAYELIMLSECGGPVRSSLGIDIHTQGFDTGPVDTVIACAGFGTIATTPGMRAYMRQALTTARRVGAICTGAFVLAQAGILDGRRATTHWGCVEELQASFPHVRMEKDRIFVVDGPVWASAGMTAGIDMALGMVEQDLGPEIARQVARSLVMYHRRAGGQQQHSALLELDAKSDRIQSALVYARSHLHTALTVEQLAGAASLSPRQFSRVFRAETGQSPAKAVEHLRLEAAKVMMEQSRHPVDVVARETGFVDRERMRRAFVRAFGQPPQAMRRHARAESHAAGPVPA